MLKGRPGERHCIIKIPSYAASKSLKLVNCEFSTHHPNSLWVADVTYFATRSGFGKLGLLIVVFSHHIFGWLVLRHMQKI